MADNKDKSANNASDRTLTTRQGHPVSNNQSQRTVGSRGPATLENYHFLEKISHFDRERVRLLRRVRSGREDWR
jgi:catalase